MTVSPVPTFGRRTILAGGAATVPVSLAASPTTSTSVPPRPEVAPVLAGHRLQRRIRDPFTLGVASGDPEPDGVVLWTRLAPRPLDNDGRGGMPDREVTVEWQVSADPGFARPARSGTVRALPRSAHAVHVEVSGLQPAREYHYRFRAEGHVSMVGRTRTAPAYDSSPNNLTMAVASCAQYEHGFFTAYRRLAEEEPHLVLHLGDYLYEMRRGDYVTTGGNVRDHLGPDTVTLADYRQRHAQYKTDPDLQGAHPVAPWAVVFDDHEVDENWAGLRPQGPQPHFRQRRAAAFRAYYEHMPLRRSSLPRGLGMRIHRRIRWGDLATVHLLDTRQYRDDQACGGVGLVHCADRLDPGRTMLGHRQEKWLLDGLAASDTAWDVLGQQVFLAERDRAAGSPELLGMEGWDGYAAARRRLLDAFAERQVRNPVVLTGDVHSHFANDLRHNFADPSSRPVGVELVTSSITSGGDGQDDSPGIAMQRAVNPHIRFGSSRRGYLMTRLERDHLKADFKTLPFVRRPGARVATRASFVVEDGNPGLVPD